MSRPAPIRRKRRSQQRGFALLMVVFLCALVLVAAMAATLSVITDGKREKEKEMIWRGNQYVRGVKLYYRKNGRFPVELEDLYKAKNGSLRFLRQPYKDPMNKEDGSWRLIYVGPSGQLIGSLKPPVSLQLPIPGSPAAPGGAPAGTTPAGTPGGSTFGSTGQTGAPGAAPGTPGAPGTGTQQGVDSSGNSTGQPGQPGAPDLPPGNVDSPTVLGGKIIGVGSKIDKRSIIVYDKAKNYRLFEFIWNPSKDAGGASQPLQSIPGGTRPGQNGQPGQSGFGQSGFGQQPSGPPTAAPPTPPPNPQN